MSLLVSSNTASLQATSSSSPAISLAGNNVNPQPGEAGNFGQVLNRSLVSQDKSAAAPPEQTLKTTGRTGIKRPADDDNKQDATPTPEWAFMTLPQVAVKTADATNHFGGQGQPQSTAENQLNAALAAAGGKTAPLTTIATPPTADAPAAKEDAASPLQVQFDITAINAAGTPHGQHVEIAKQGATGEHSSLMQGPEQLIAKAATGDTAGQQATRDDGRSERNGKLEKLGKQDRQASQANADADVRHADTAATVATTGHDVAATKSGATGSAQFTLDTSVPAHTSVAANQITPPVTNTTAPTAAALKLPLAPPVGSDGWGAALGKQVVWLSNSGNQTAELHLNPPDLGPLKVTLTINDNQAQAMFVSAHQAVRSAVEAALPQLRNSLADNGISLGNTSVSADTQQQQSAFAQQQGAQDGSRSHLQRNGSGGGPAGSQTVAERSHAPVSRRSSNGNVDTFA
ncbi:flagellar hook-length control FliK family protein [Collimonas arenae]|uniref:Flagellar hook-length control FliK family protein n=1 Tax=Collimonas arenae TaxID=279058 RepID=A0A127QFI0_9BURK|nr:flagellar hook-length control protein FliK [Collimonas arenae]AMO98849.1 flagellar hook-length control FliK family protein [Collimonas arenae]AMP08746.1 flagellar hook-length control FliK family protein [Collimonas arenae]